MACLRWNRWILLPASFVGPPDESRPWGCEGTCVSAQLRAESHLPRLQDFKHFTGPRTPLFSSPLSDLLASTLHGDWTFLAQIIHQFGFHGQNYDAKLSDFGLARDGPTDQKSHVSTRVIGTYGYAAPEYLATGTICFSNYISLMILPFSHLIVKESLRGQFQVFKEIIMDLAQV